VALTGETLLNKHVQGETGEWVTWEGDDEAAVEEEEEGHESTVSIELEPTAASK
jgi:hypothetical protein